VLFVPLIVHELRTSFQETGYVLDYLRGGDTAPAGGPVASLAFTLLRVVGWPIVGLVTDVPAAAAIVLAATVGLAAIGLLQARGIERTGLAWLVGILAWSTIVLAFVAPSLQRVVAGLPNDHYHAFLDPIVVILVAAPAARLLERTVAAWRATHRPAPAIAAGIVAAGIAAIIAVALVRNPPAVDPDGGWPAMQAAGRRVAAEAQSFIALLGLPDFKLPDAVGYPIAHAGGHLVADAMNASRIVVACDRLFESVIGAPCRGPAEDALIGAKVGFKPDGQSFVHLVDRFDASPRTSISVYAP
jgi:hypothetical protein